MKVRTKQMCVARITQAEQIALIGIHRNILRTDGGGEKTKGNGFQTRSLENAGHNFYTTIQTLVQRRRN